MTGKSTLSDLREGKCTPLIAHARTTAWWPRIQPCLAAGHLDEDDAVQVRQMLHACGARAAVEDLIDGHRRAAVELAEGLDLAGLLDRIETLTYVAPGSAWRGLPGASR